MATRDADLDFRPASDRKAARGAIAQHAAFHIQESDVRKTILATLFAGALACASGPSFAATTTYRVTVPGGVSFDMQRSPTWVAVPEARNVYIVRDDMRPTTDYFRYQGSYYVYSGGHWYRSTTWNGRYTVVADNRVPKVFYSVKQERWRAYPPGWQKRM